MPRRTAVWLLAATVVVGLAGCSAPSATASRPPAAAPKTGTTEATVAAPTAGTAEASAATPKTGTTEATVAASKTGTTETPAAASKTGPTEATVAAPTAGTAEAPAAVSEAGGGDEPTIAYIDAAQHFRFDYPRSWGKSTPPGEAIRLTGRDEFISVAVVSSTQAPLDYAKADAPQLSAASAGYKSAGPKAYKVAGASGAMVAYTWEAGPSPVTGKQVPSSANRYYIPGPAGKLAVFTYSTPTSNYDPAGADDFANAFKWLP